jgi:uncharacterized membrane protein
MRGWKAILSVVLIFMLGAMAGALVMHRTDQHRIESIMKGESRMTSEVIVARLSRKLNLDAVQEQQLSAIVRETHAQMRSVRNQYRPQIEELLKQSQDKVRTILHPDQLETFNKIVAERKKRHEAEEDNK